MITYMNELTYIHDGVEVKKTGRVATKSTMRNNSIHFQIVEITPIDKSYNWTKWVRPEDLYIITNQSNE